jgi:hypothetical protein
MKPLTTKVALILIGLSVTHCSQKKAELPVSTQTSVTGAPDRVETEALPELAPSSAEAAPAAAAEFNAAAQTPGALQPAPSLPKQELQANLAEPVTSKEPEPAACLTFSFQHHAAANHTLGPDCAHHKNRIALPQEIRKGEHDLNHLCIRVDGVAVTSVRDKDTLILGAAPRSRSVITVRACRKGTQCQESCKIPKDELISDLAGESDPSEGGWDQESALKVNGALDDTIKRELAALDEEEVSKEWSLDGAPTELIAGSCGAGGKKTLTARKKN